MKPQTIEGFRYYDRGDGTLVPSVTTVLKHDSFKIDCCPDILKAASERGERIHNSLHLYCKGINPASDLKVAFDSLFGDRKPYATEHFIPSELYAGTLDLIVEDSDNRLTLVDLKTKKAALKIKGGYKSLKSDSAHKYQLSAYFAAWNHRHPDRQLSGAEIWYIGVDDSGEAVHYQSSPIKMDDDSLQERLYGCLFSFYQHPNFVRALTTNQYQFADASPLFAHLGN